MWRRGGRRQHAAQQSAQQLLAGLMLQPWLMLLTPLLPRVGVRERVWAVCVCVLGWVSVCNLCAHVAWGGSWVARTTTETPQPV